MIDHAVESQASLLDSPRSTLKETGHGDMENAARFPHLPPTATTNYCVQMTRKISSSGCPRLAIPSSPPPLPENHDRQRSLNFKLA